MHIELSMFFNVRCIKFIECVIGPGKLALSAKYIPLMDIIIAATLHELPFHICRQSSYR